jgi:hypothetical protein
MRQSVSRVEPAEIVMPGLLDGYGPKIAIMLEVPLGAVADVDMVLQVFALAD